MEAVCFADRYLANADNSGHRDAHFSSCDYIISLCIRIKLKVPRLWRPPVLFLDLLHVSSRVVVLVLDFTSFPFVHLMLRKDGRRSLPSLRLLFQKLQCCLIWQLLSSVLVLASGLFAWDLSDYLD